MSFIDQTIGPTTAMSQFDPNRPDIYVDTLYDERYGIHRAVYGGCTYLDLRTRAKTNESEAQINKTTPYLSFLRFSKEREIEVTKKYAPFRDEQHMLDHFGLKNLLNVRRGGGGRRPSVWWEPYHVDAAISERDLSDLEAEYGIRRHQWIRLRTRILDRHNQSCWHDMEYVKAWKIDDLRRFMLLM